MGQLCSSDESQMPQAKQNPPQQSQQQQPRNNNNGYPGANAGGASRQAPHQDQHAASSHAAASSSSGDSMRFQASQHAQKRGELLGQSQAAYQRGDKALAKQLSEQGKAEGRLMEQCNAAAAEAYFAENNRNHDRYTMDLHGLHVDEAIAKVEARLAECQRSRQDHLVVVFGRGNHSKDHVQKLKPAMERLIAEHHLRVAVGAPNLGCVTIEFNSSEGRGIGTGGGQSAQQATDQCVQQ
jgi:hypothetical protein